MKTLTLFQPWASLVAIGAKCIETRSWCTAYRGPLAIHASAGYGPGGKRAFLDRCATKPFCDVLIPGPAYSPRSTYTDRLALQLPLGAIVAVVNLTSIHRITESGVEGLHLQPSADELAFGDYTPGRYAWVLSQAYRLDNPMPARGMLGLWDVERVVDG